MTSPKKIGPYGPHVENTALATHRRLLAELKGVQANLAFTPCVMTGALQRVATENVDAWAFTAADVASFAADVGPRVRRLCRHTSQALLRVQIPKWAQAIADLAELPKVE